MSFNKAYAIYYKLREEGKVDINSADIRRVARKYSINVTQEIENYVKRLVETNQSK